VVDNRHMEAENEGMAKKSDETQYNVLLHSAVVLVVICTLATRNWNYIFF